MAEYQRLQAGRNTARRDMRSGMITPEVYDRLSAIITSETAGTQRKLRARQELTAALQAQHQMQENARQIRVEGQATEHAANVAAGTTKPIYHADGILAGTAFFLPGGHVQWVPAQPGEGRFNLQAVTRSHTTDIDREFREFAAPPRNPTRNEQGQLVPEPPRRVPDWLRSEDVMGADVLFRHGGNLTARDFTPAEIAAARNREIRNRVNAARQDHQATQVRRPGAGGQSAGAEADGEGQAPADQAAALQQLLQTLSTPRVNPAPTGLTTTATAEERATQSQAPPDDAVQSLLRRGYTTPGASVMRSANTTKATRFWAEASPAVRQRIIRQQSALFAQPANRFTP
jgi:uncharacterized protein YeaC (DUF1315 family)